MDNNDKDKTPPDDEADAEKLEQLARAIDKDRNLSDYFLNSVIHQVEKNMYKRNRLRMVYARITALVLFAIIGPAAYFGINNIINTSVNERLEQKSKQTIAVINQKINQGLIDTQRQLYEDTEKKFEAVEREIKVKTTHLALLSTVIYLDIHSNYTKEDIYYMMRLFKDATKMPELIQKSDFPILLDKAIISLIQRNDYANLQKLEKWFSEVIIDNPRTINQLAEFYGEQLVGSIYPPSRWKEDEVAAYKKYLTLANTSENYVGYIPINMLYEFRVANNQTSGTINVIFKNIKNLPPEKQFTVLKKLVKYTDPKFWRGSTGQVEDNIASVSEQFMSAYKDKIKQIAKQASVKALLDNEIEKQKDNRNYDQDLKKYLAE